LDEIKFVVFILLIIHIINQNVNFS